MDENTGLKPTISHVVFRVCRSSPIVWTNDGHITCSSDGLLVVCLTCDLSYYTSRSSPCSSDVWCSIFESPGMNLFIANHICLEIGDIINCSAYGDVPKPLPSPSPSFHFMLPDATKEFVGKPVYKGLSRWLAGQLKSKKNEDHVHAALQKGAYLKPLTDFVVSGTGCEANFLFSKLDACTLELQANIFGPTLLMADAGHSTTGFLPFAAPHTFLCAEGSFLVVAVHHELIVGFSYSAKREAFNNMSSEALKGLLAVEKAIVCKMSPGCVFHCPVGMIVRQAAISNAVVFKWAVHDGSVQESKKVLSSAMLHCSSFPELATGAFSSWMKVLQEAVAQIAS
jgi:hypothetical protein